jgi:hypothetical protein
MLQYLLECRDCQVTTSVSFLPAIPCQSSAHVKLLGESVRGKGRAGVCDEEHFNYDTLTNTYRCPAGQIMKSRRLPPQRLTRKNVTLYLPGFRASWATARLGKDGSPPSTPSSWSPGLRIIPDHALVTGEKTPPITPNIIDVRIVRQDMTADFPSPTGLPAH